MKSKVDKMIGNYDLRNLTKDYDKDKVINVLDCKPLNPKQQGLVHKAGAFVARRFGAEKTAERIERREETVEAAREVGREERAEQMRETARFREQHRGERQREFIKGGGFMGAARRSFAPRPRPAPRQAPLTFKKRKLPKVTRRKVKKKAIKKVVRQPFQKPMKKEKDPLSRMMGL